MSKRQKELFPEITSGKEYVSDIPALAEEWHDTKNLGKLPEDFTSGSNKKVWWKCSKGHEWQTQIYLRAKRGTNCPYCSGQLPSEEHNLLVKYPDIAKEWHPTKNDKKPEEFTPYSNKKVWWKCERGHEWHTPIAHRTVLGNGCAKCSNQSSKNEIRILTELIAAFGNAISRHKVDGLEVDVYLPDQNTAIEYDGKYWHRDKAEQDREKQYIIEGKGIKFLRVREAPLPKLNDSDIIIPSGSLITKDQINKLVIKIGDEFNTPYISANRFLNDDLYRTYLDYFPSPFPEKSLAKQNPQLAREWHPNKNNPLTPSNFLPNARQKAWWKCDQGHEWQAAIYSRNGGSHKCPYCVGHKATPETCLAVTHPKVAAMWHPTKNGEATPYNTKAGSGIKRWWQCVEDPSHEWELIPDKMKAPRKSEHCPHCRSLAFKHPYFVSIWHPAKNGDATPYNTSAGSSTKVWWRCNEVSEHEWQNSPANITKPDRKLGYCPYCTGRRKWKPVLTE